MLKENELDNVSGALYASKETEKFYVFTRTWDLHDCWRKQNAN